MNRLFTAPSTFGHSSAEQIAGRLKVEVLRPHRLCHETIYQYVYSADGQSQYLARYLPERRRKRKPRHARKPRSLVFPAIMGIHHRPAEVNDRSQFGHWEGDLMIFRREHGQANMWGMIPLWALIGFGFSFTQTPIGRILNRSARPEDRPAVFAAQFALSHAAWLITYPLAGWLGSTYGLPEAALGLAAIATLAMIAVSQL